MQRGERGDLAEVTGDLDFHNVLVNIPHKNLDTMP